MTEPNADCESCGDAIPMNEVQQCGFCGMDLCERCIGQLDHECDKEEEDEDDD